MAIVHKATLRPPKPALLAAWLPSQPWFTGDATALAQVGAFRFDDPDGEVGLQVVLLRAGEETALYQVPLTYRGAPMEAAGEALIGETTHSVLGPRYVYDGCHDPVFVGELVRAVLTGGTEVDEHMEADGETITMPKSIHARGTGPMAAVPAVGPLDVTSAGADGALTVVRTGGVEVTIPRVLRPGTTIDGASTLVAEWGDGESACLASLRFVEEPVIDPQRQ